MNHASLFSGIGGFDLAAEWAGWTNVFNCEIDPFCRKVLKYHFPNVIQLGDIKQAKFKRNEQGNVWIRQDGIITDTNKRGYASTVAATGIDKCSKRETFATCERWQEGINQVQTEEWLPIGPVDILTGGFPCQPFSMAGKRRGTDDDRHLWPEMLRAIREIKPTWIVGENVYGFTNWNGGLVFREVLSDLENEGYEVQPFIIPACSVNAPHRRDRVWIVAHATNARGGNGMRIESEWSKEVQRNGRKQGFEFGKVCKNRTVENTGGARCGNGESEEQVNFGNEREFGTRGKERDIISKNGNAADTDISKRSEGGCTRTEDRQNDTLAHSMHGIMNGEPGTTSQLNHRFVAEMMGFPVNWTELPFLNCETNPSNVTETQSYHK